MWAKKGSALKDLPISALYFHIVIPPTDTEKEILGACVLSASSGPGDLTVRLGIRVRAVAEFSGERLGVR